MIVAKFGGTSVTDSAAIRRLIEIVRGKIPEQPVIVVSALAGMTDALLNLAVQAGSEDGDSMDQALDSLLRRHEQIAESLPGAETALESVVADGEALRQELRALKDSRVTPAQLDVIASRGELWSSRLVAAALDGAGISAAWIDIRPIVVTDARFTRATPYVQVVNTKARECLRPLCEAGQVPVTQGFIGATAAGASTTLGRGGSDFTAALLGAALTARRVEIWTDVDGLMTADPRIVPSARTLKAASYEEAAELATFGFLRALFEVFERHETVVDVLASGEISISITIKDRSRLTPLMHDLEELGDVWVEEHRAVIAVVGIGLRNTPGLAGRVFNAVWPANVEVISQGSSSINMTFVVREEDGPDVVRRLHREFFGSD